MRSKFSFQSQKDHIKYLIQIANIINKEGALKTAKRILVNKTRYVSVQDVTKIHWALIAAIHNKEASLRFDRNLCNGQLLTMKTTMVPKGLGPWSSWEQSAIDAINLQHRVTAQIDLTNGMDLVEMLFWAEAYNGWGYQKHAIHSPYVWAGTDNYTKGAFVSDGVYNPEYVIKNTGIFCTLWAIRQIQGHLDESTSDLEARPTFEIFNSEA